jgi:hypothetical protein
MSRLLLLALLAAAMPFAMGCPDEPGTTDDGGPGEGEGEGEGGTGGPLDVGCQADTECATGEICDLGTGDCVAGLDCSSNTGICSFCGESGTDCGFGAAPAYCDEGAGVCRREKGTCTPCAVDDECAGDAQSGLPGKCLGGYCAKGCGQCPAGFTCSDSGCVPAEQALPEGAETCGDLVLCPEGTGCPDGTQCSDLGVCLVICNEDRDCGPGKVCWQEAGPLLGLCLNGCPEGETRTNAGDAEICYANGRWGPPCPTPTETTGCPAGLECAAGGQGNYCDLSGCQDDDDCDLARTYCDTGTGECVEGCNSDDDCGAFELCELETNTCKKQGCRGKDVSCNLGEWCCGHELYSDATSCPSPVEEGQCFLAPDPWCRVCEDNDDCGDIDDFGFSSYCFELTREDEEGNEETLGKFCSVGCQSNADCPRGVPCVQDIEVDGEMINACIDALCVAISGARGGQ